jgi:hypothetical protein
LSSLSAELIPPQSVLSGVKGDDDAASLRADVEERSTAGALLACCFGVCRMAAVAASPSDDRASA